MPSGFIGVVDESTTRLANVPLVKSLGTNTINFVNTTASTSVGAGAIAAVTVASMTGILAGYALVIDTIQSGVQESVLVTNTTGSTFTAQFSNAHTAPFAVAFNIERPIVSIGDAG